ncbi:hypothetical protein LPJ61_001796 [Coemansia biformis]|uniref:Myb-like, SWIRM and MPN domain-containing protein 1 n=1 Tax=Coemansia biformis TaxID=1286918 RepID=A0A9W7YFQ8_9FUNG|nr:hypothetical protein LPJ61_001796 [Coemansia biformis]
MERATSGGGLGAAGTGDAAAASNGDTAAASNGDTLVASAGGAGELQRSLTVDPAAVNEAERQGCREFFMGKANKTPERYMRIRNHMVQAWAAQRPQYLTKIKARAGLKDCGDVNAIGRVHTFLEGAGIINAGAEPTHRKPRANGVQRPRQPRRSNGHGNLAGDAFPESDDGSLSPGSDGGVGGWHGRMGNGVPSSTGRRRRVRDEDGSWVYEDEYYGGRVISHDVVERHADDADYNCSSPSSDEGAPRQSKRRRRGNGERSGASKWIYNSNSEFRLIPCQAFGVPLAPTAPFAVRISAAALALMDLHAHLMYTEIIGLLGGRFRAAERVVEVEVAFPCRSTSTTTECEMDPASEVEARRVFSAGGCQVVGWFHSHPTFEATPSVRDIHNQHAYQTLCRRSSDQVEPFVGVIVSPPGGGGPYGVSDISVFYVVPRARGPGDGDGDAGAGDGDGGAEGVPFQVPYEVVGGDAIPDDLMDAMARVIETHAGLAHRADLAKRFRRNEAMTTLEKLAISMRWRWADAVRQQWDDVVSTRLRPLLQQHFCRGAAAGSSAGARASSAPHADGP